MASDSTLDPTGARSATATVTVLVERNEAPVIQNRNSYIRTISEGAGIDSVIMTIVAIDPNPADSKNGMLMYQINDNDAMKRFQINGSGAITPRVFLKDVEQLNWVVRNSYILNLSTYM